jgi:hypothetical protein
MGGPKYYAVNLILRLFLYHFFTYDELVTSRVHPQQHKQPTNTTTMVMDPLAPGMVHANVGQKLLKCNILRVFIVSQN